MRILLTIASVFILFASVALADSQRVSPQMKEASEVCEAAVRDMKLTQGYAFFVKSAKLLTANGNDEKKAYVFVFYVNMTSYDGATRNEYMKCGIRLDGTQWLYQVTLGQY